MGKLNGRAEDAGARHDPGQKVASEGRPRSWSEPWAYPFESDEHYEERREAFNQGYGITDPSPCLFGDLLRNDGEARQLAGAERGGWREQPD